jgi:hypothetical protein
VPPSGGGLKNILLTIINYVLFQSLNFFSLILVAVDHLATEFVPQLNPNPETPFNQNYPVTNLLGNINCGQNVTL